MHEDNFELEDNISMIDQLNIHYSRTQQFSSRSNCQARLGHTINSLDNHVHCRLFLMR